MAACHAVYGNRQREIAKLTRPKCIQRSVTRNAVLKVCCSFLEEFLKRRLVNDHIPNRSQSLPALFLFLQKLSPPTDICCVQLGQHILSERLERFSRDDPIAHSRLYNHFEHLSVNVLLELGDPVAAKPVHLGVMNDAADGVYGVFVDE
jgi:hypothetical protein